MSERILSYAIETVHKVFREPQYDGKVVATVIEGTGAREGVLDPLGAGLTPGPQAYPQLIQNLGTALKDCLSG